MPYSSKLTGNDTQCPTCKEIFSCEKYYNAHRKGKYSTGKYCVHPTTVGMTLNDRGRWAIKVSKEEVERLKKLNCK